MIQFDRVSFFYGKKPVLTDFSLTVPDGELLSVMGPSGGGKTTLLHLMAGLRTPTGGTLTVDEHLPAVAFQEPRLFPWLTALGNIRAVLPKDAPAAVADEALALVGLSDEANALPDALSGGMRSRVSLARAVAYGEAVGSSLYLLDEPFSALDEATRQTLCAALRERIRAAGATAVLVTHDPDDAARFGDRVIRVGDGNDSNNSNGSNVGNDGNNGNNGNDSNHGNDGNRGGDPSPDGGKSGPETV